VVLVSPDEIEPQRAHTGYSFKVSNTHGRARMDTLAVTSQRKLAERAAKRSSEAVNPGVYGGTWEAWCTEAERGQ
jgi:hypothetical protein